MTQPIVGTPVEQSTLDARVESGAPDWGIDGDREWPQYLFEADPEQSPDEPPIEVTREHPMADRLIQAD